MFTAWNALKVHPFLPRVFINFFPHYARIACPIATLQACLIADIVQYFVDAKLDFDACYVYEDVNRAIQHVHRSGLVHAGILSDPITYLVKNVGPPSYLSCKIVIFCLKLQALLFLIGAILCGWNFTLPKLLHFLYVVNISGPAVTFSEDAEGKGEKAFFADQLSIYICGWGNAVSVGGISFFVLSIGVKTK